MKKFIAVFVFIILMAQTAGAEFYDISDDPAKEKIEYLEDMGVLKGDGNGMFMPEKTVTRAEFAAMVNRAMGYENAQEGSLFSDVSPSDWFFADVCTAAKMGIINGYPDGSFNPDGAVTHEQAVKILVSVYENIYSLSPSGDMATLFDDYYDISDWARDYVSKGTMLSIAKGYSSVTLFEPQMKVNRSQAADMIYSLLNSVEISKKAQVSK